MSASILEELKTAFPDESHGPILNELLSVLHYMGIDEATKSAFCRKVVVKGGVRFLGRFTTISKNRFSDSEVKFKELAKFLDKSAPTDLKLSPG